MRDMTHSQKACMCDMTDSQKEMSHLQMCHANE